MSKESFLSCEMPALVPGWVPLEGRRELAALALHRKSEALRNFLLSRSPSCLEPTPWFVLALANLERCLAVLQLPGQQTHPVSACSRLWNSRAGWG